MEASSSSETGSNNTSMPAFSGTLDFTCEASQDMSVLGLLLHLRPKRGKKIHWQRVF